MVRAPALLFLFAVSCTTLDRPGGPLHVEHGYTRTAHDVVSRDEYRLSWRERAAETLALEVVGDTAALPEPLAVARADGRPELHLRFPSEGGGVGLALLGGEGAFSVEEAIVEAVWVQGRSPPALHPVGRLRLVGALSAEAWQRAIRAVEGDPAPNRDLVDEVKSGELRFRLARGVGRVIRLGVRTDVPSTFELAAIRRDGRDVEDWHRRVHLALAAGRFGLLRGCTAIIREHAFGARRGEWYWEVPLPHVVIASEVEVDGRRWRWLGNAVVLAGAPRADRPALPEGLPWATLRLVTIRERRYLHGMPPILSVPLAALGTASAWVLEVFLGYTPIPSGWPSWFDDWSQSGLGRHHQRQGGP